MILIIRRELNQMILINYCTDISAIYADISASFIFILKTFHKLTFLCRIYVKYIGNLPIYRRY